VIGSIKGRIKWSKHIKKIMKIERERGGGEEEEEERMRENIYI